MKKAIIATASGLLLSASVFVAGAQAGGAGRVAYPIVTTTTTTTTTIAESTTSLESEGPVTTTIYVESQIPATGGDAGSPIALGATVFAIGAGLVLVTRRRKHSPAG